MYLTNEYSLTYKLIKSASKINTHVKININISKKSYT